MEDYEAQDDAIDILSRACSDTLESMTKEWSADKEMAFCMIRRAMRHAVLGSNVEMY
jgi:hypothetical protein